MDDINAKTDEERIGGVQFDSLSPENQKMLLNNMMEGKPQTPQNLNKAKQILSSDPDTVESMCEKLGIDCDEDNSTVEDPSGDDE